MGRALAALCRKAPRANWAVTASKLTADVVGRLVGLLAELAASCKGQQADEEGQRAGSACGGTSWSSGGSSISASPARVDHVLEAVLAALADLAGHQATRGQVGPDTRPGIFRLPHLAKAPSMPGCASWCHLPNH